MGDTTPCAARARRRPTANPDQPQCVIRYVDRALALQRQIRDGGRRA
jgi:hypothetical protein